MRLISILFLVLFISGPLYADQATPQSRSGITQAPGLTGDYKITAKRIPECTDNLAACDKKARSGDLDSIYALGAEELMSEGKSQLGLKKIKHAAEQGHVDSQALLGMITLGWDNIPSDPERARYWWEKAAEAGHLEARKNIGKMYFYGDGGEQNYAKAAEIFTDIYLEDPEAAYYLGLAYLNGHGVTKSQDNAIKLIRIAAYKNIPAAQRSFGEWLILQGRMDDAYIWLGQAAMQNDQKALQMIMGLEQQVIKDPALIRQLQKQSFAFQQKLKRMQE